MPVARFVRCTRVAWVACFAFASAACGSDSGESTAASTTSATTSTSSGGGEGGASTTTGAGGDGGGSTTSSAGVGGAGGAPNPQTGVPGTELVNAGAVMSSPGYRLQLTVGQSSPLQTKASSPGHSIRGGVLGTTN